ncbi:MAG TPA: hypothetical protein VK688_11635 [Gemmatimonadales bacterium]|jgi:hypothetical protein|nr:hypothetical protein [Gemmatimonadales bacterium]
MGLRSTLIASAIGLAIPAGGVLHAQMAMTKSSDLRAGLNTILQEHVYLASAATGAALGGRQAEFEGAAAALDENSVALSKAIGSVYGPDAEAAFLALWRKHIGFVVDYTTGLAAKDKGKQDKAVNDLLGYAGDFGAFLNAANPNLPKDVVAGLVKTHILTLKDVIDVQAMGDPKAAYAKERVAAAHMQMIADPLADGIAKQFPKRYAMK